MDDRQPATVVGREYDPPTGQSVLALPLSPDCYWDAADDGATIRDYLTTLLDAIWAGDATVTDGMVGQSDWEYDLYQPLATAGLIPAWTPGWGVGHRPDGTTHPEDRLLATRLISDAIAALGQPPATIRVIDLNDPRPLNIIGPFADATARDASLAQIRALPPGGWYVEFRPAAIVPADADRAIPPARLAGLRTVGDLMREMTHD